LAPEIAAESGIFISMGEKSLALKLRRENRL
jgi:hypothetical protein